ncbi:THUMP domain-containing family [Micractinium conductrix]|uniref:THUMP domain-containing family n=1 Tax=Micractinium conductrix TaxID=554055 RepID=A0A2P6VEW8_9CHLO|nr:THUMP domain-containing family [Micractinium conductrix]|eukprot:PSC72640.1 THUMP domain-containing family [Micractinium conductrix]
MTGGNKRKEWGRGGGGGGKSNKKRFMNRGAPTGGKGGVPLGSRGILVSCTNSKETPAGREAADLFTEIYEQLGGTWKRAATAAGPTAGATDADAADAPPTDIAAALASEVAELKDTAKSPLFYHLTGIHSVVYLECKDADGPSPSAMVLAASEAAAAQQRNPTRWCLRFSPVELTCFASMEKIGELAAKVVAEHFPADTKKPIEFAVQYDARAAPELDRMAVINAFANLVPAPHKVNLNAPQKTILVNLVKGTCGVAVVQRFRELFRYNIRTLAQPEEEREREINASRAANRAQPGGSGGAGGKAEQQEQAAESKEEEQQKGGEAAEGEQAAAATAADAS